MTTFLTVPYAEKDQAKSLGARWNAEKKKWYVPAGSDLGPFKKWTSAEEAGSHSVAKTPSMEEIGLTIVGDRYVERSHDCIPWLPCAACDGSKDAGVR
jgi:hypothetical protein